MMSTVTVPAVDLDRLSINTIRTLSMDAVQQAKSGHPGTPMAMAPVVYALSGFRLQASGRCMVHRISFRRSIMRANAAYLGIAAAVSFFALDLRAVLFDQGPERVILGQSTMAAIGFIEAHGLAFILAVLFWRAEPVRSWHLTAAATAALLGISNLAFWDGFVVSGSVPMGVVATGLHLSFAAMQSVLAVTARRERPVASPLTGVTARQA